MNDKLPVKADLTKSANEIITDLCKPATKQVGKALGNVAGLLNTTTLPFKLANDYAQANYKKYSEKIKDIAEENIKEVEPEIGIPLMEKLSYTSNEDLANAYANLLANASQKNKVDLVHPGFINKINSMAPDEVRILEYLKVNFQIPYIYFKAKGQGKSRRLSLKLTGLEKKFNISANFLAVNIDNLISLNIITDKEGEYIADQNIYETLSMQYNTDKKNYEQRIGVGDLKDFNKIETMKSFYFITDIGRTFINACTNQKD